MYIEIETERLLIRPISIDDNQFILKLLNSEAWLEFIGDRKVLNLDDAKNYIQKILDSNNAFYSILIQKETKNPIGIISYLKRDNQELPDFGFALLPEYQKQGFAYEASYNYLDYLFSQIPNLEIIAITLPNNTTSINLLMRLGFKFSTNKSENNEILSYYFLSKNNSVNPEKANTHNYKTTIKWTGNKGLGTTNYKAYKRDHIILIDGKNEILGSSDPAFRGDKKKHNPEDLLLSSLSACHMLWYLHLCSQEGIIVLDYTDNATGTMKETENVGGHFTEVTLNPIVTVSEKSMIEKANELHKKANELCFIANSVNFPVHHQTTTISK